MSGLLFLLLASTAFPPDGDWRWVGMSEGESGRRAWYMDKASLVREGDRVGFLQLAIFRPAGQSGTLKAESYRAEGDCTARSLTLYERDLTTGDERPGVALRAEPKTPAADLLDAACKARFAGRVRDVVGNARLLFVATPRKKKAR